MLQEIERRPTYTVARATLIVLKCLYGQACRRNPTLQMSFTPETLREGALGVDFLLGREYLLLFKQPSAKALVFGTDWSRNMDIAFVLKTPLQPLSALEPASDTLTFENAWGGPPQRLDRVALEAWAAQRSRDLAR